MNYERIIFIKKLQFLDLMAETDGTRENLLSVASSSNILDFLWELMTKREMYYFLLVRSFIEMVQPRDTWCIRETRKKLYL